MAASTKTLGNLHALVSASLEADLEAAMAIEDPVIRVAAVKEVRAQIITFLKNNNITADIETDDRLRGLREKLAARPSTPSLRQAEEDFATAHANLMQ